MPELPEVETIVTRLQRILPGKQIKSLECFREKSVKGDSSLVERLWIKRLSRRSKIIQIDLTAGKTKDESSAPSPTMHLLVHLKMTGQLLFDQGKSNKASASVMQHNHARVGGGHPTLDWLDELPNTSTRACITFTDESVLFFNDQRVFGWIKIVSPAQLPVEYSGLGPDVIDPVVTTEYLLQRLAKTGSAIKLAIMNNQIIAGVGNIYACDGLFEAGIDPRRPARSLSQSEVSKLLQALKLVINQGIELGGATIKNYRTSEGLQGGYQHVRRVYAREHEPCLRCGTPIERFAQGGRSTFWCPVCQASI